jgi:hypothetical protein
LPGYISRRLADIEHVDHDREFETQTFLSNPYIAYKLVGIGINLTCLIIGLKKEDKECFEIALHYDMDENFQQIYEQFSHHFGSFAGSARI